MSERTWALHFRIYDDTREYLPTYYGTNQELPRNIYASNTEQPLISGLGFGVPGFGFGVSSLARSVKPNRYNCKTGKASAGISFEGVKFFQYKTQ